MADWRESSSPHQETKEMPQGFKPAHTIEIYKECSGGKLQEVESDTESSIDPADNSKIIIRHSTRIIHTGTPCDGFGAQPGGITIKLPLPKPPEPPEKDPWQKEREAIAAFNKHWDEASPNPPAH